MIRRTKARAAKRRRRAYNEKTKQFVANEDVEAKAEEAAQALEGKGDEQEAEEEGRSHAHGEDPQVHRDK